MATRRSDAGLVGRVERFVAGVFLHHAFRAQLARLGGILAVPGRDDGWTLPLRPARGVAVAPAAGRTI